MAVNRPSTSSQVPLVSTGTVIVAVASTGSDAYTTQRPSDENRPREDLIPTTYLSAGDYSSIPYKTLQAAVDAMPFTMRHNCYIRLGAETYAGASVSGILGGGYLSGGFVGLTINGTYSAVTPTTGVASGTAGSGTNSTTLVKPTGAVNWTASDLLGKFIKITGGGGAGSDPTNKPVVRAITANTTTNITVPTVSGVDSTTTFQIVSPGSLISEITGDTVPLRINFNGAAVTVRGVKFTSTGSLTSLISSTGNANLTFDGCLFDFNTSDAGVLSDKDSDVLISNCVFSTGADATIRNCARYVEGRGLYATGSGQLKFEKCLSGKMQLVSLSSLGTVFNATAMQFLEGDISATSSGAVPVYLESISYFEAVGTNKLSGGSNTGYGCQLEGSGLFRLTGSSITGSGGDINLFGTSTTWANIASSTYGSAGNQMGTAIAYATVAKHLQGSNYLFSGSVDVSGRLLAYGYINQSANLSSANLTNTTPYDMETNGVRGVLEANSTNAGAIVVLPSNSAIAGVVVWIVNIGTQQLTVQAPSGGTLTGTATIAAGTAAAFVSLNGNTGKDFMRVGA
jgi:hypothetical protein